MEESVHTGVLSAVPRYGKLEFLRDVKSGRRGTSIPRYITILTITGGVGVGVGVGHEQAGLGAVNCPREAPHLRLINQGSTLTLPPGLETGVETVVRSTVWAQLSIRRRTGDSPLSRQRRLSESPPPPPPHP
eukprot:COSAG02_NODE_7563_length_2960_cov_0.992310_1_plen_131_part_10